MRYSIATFFLFLIPFSALNAQSFAGGDGSVENPYQIETPVQLSEVRNFLDSHFILNNDIDLSFATGDSLGQFWNDGKGWEPIGNEENLFKGSFNGSGFIIKGINIVQPSGQFLGLFGMTDINVEIRDIMLIDVKILGERKIGGLVGLFQNGIIENVSVDAQIEGFVDIGGLIGTTHSSTIINSFSSGSIDADYTIGGLVGSFTFGIIEDSYSTVDVIGKNDVTGGLLGYSYQSTIKNTYSVGRVIGDKRIGGLIGWGNEVSVINSFWNIESSGQFISDGGEGKTTIELLHDSTFEGWDFSVSGSWKILNGESYPYLNWQDSVEIFNRPKEALSPTNLRGESGKDSLTLNWEPPSFGMPIGYNLYRNGLRLNVDSVLVITKFTDTKIDSNSYYEYFVTAVYDSISNHIESATTNVLLIYTGYAGGDGNVENPYGITNIYQLQETENHLDKHFIIKNNIDASATVEWNDSLGFEPIGGFSLDEAFTGSLNGNGYTIDSLTINRPKESFVGLFSYIRGGTIKNIGLRDVDIKGLRFVGGIVGDIEFGEVMNSFTTGVVASPGYEGLTGGEIGGLVGLNNDGIIMSSYSSARVTGAHEVGGLIGASILGSVRNNYSTGEVSGIMSVGGLIGQAGDGEVIHNYSIGVVYSEGEQLGGLIGHSEKVHNKNYWNVETSGQIKDGGSAAKKSSGEMALESTFEGWDFSDDGSWSINEGRTFPYLKWQHEAGPHNDANIVFMSSPENQAMIDIPYTLEWEPVENSAYYEVEISIGTSFLLIDFDSTITNSTSAEIEELKPNTRYYWRVSSFDSLGNMIKWPAVREFTVNLVTSNESSEVPERFSMDQNYPNPFNPNTTIKYSLPQSSNVQLIVYDMLGRKVTELINSFKREGYHSISFDASKLASGVYIYRLEAGDFVSTKRMLLVK